MILFKKEKEVIGRIVDHIDTVELCLLTAEKALQFYLAGGIADAKKLARDVDAIEAEADMIRHDIRDKLYYGAYMPLLKEDIYKLVVSLDMVANAAEESCDFCLNQRPRIPEPFKILFSETIKVSLGIAKPLKESVMCYVEGVCPIEVTREHSRDIGIIESKVDKLEWDLTKMIFSSDLEFSRKLHLRQCLDTIVEVSDQAENAADQLELVTLKSLT